MRDCSRWANRSPSSWRSNRPADCLCARSCSCSTCTSSSRNAVARMSFSPASASACADVLCSASTAICTRCAITASRAATSLAYTVRASPRSCRHWPCFFRSVRTSSAICRNPPSSEAILLCASLKMRNASSRCLLLACPCAIWMRATARSRIVWCVKKCNSLSGRVLLGLGGVPSGCSKSFSTTACSTRALASSKRDCTCFVCSAVSCSRRQFSMARAAGEVWE
mmetsp:Transcript_22276/g.37246  ORF Transcript_22276/g.37246 Transcript_22276/m.37246 type:complete len:225 (+) Transcript_22276:71-745(+)